MKNQECIEMQLNCEEQLENDPSDLIKAMVTNALRMYVLGEIFSIFHKTLIEEDLKDSFHAPK